MVAVYCFGLRSLAAKRKEQKSSDHVLLGSTRCRRRPRTHPEIVRKSQFKRGAVSDKGIGWIHEKEKKKINRIRDWYVLSAEFCLISRFRKLDRERDILDYTHFVDMRPIQLEPCQSCSGLMGNVLLHRRGCGPLRLLTRRVSLYQTPICAN